MLEIENKFYTNCNGNTMSYREKSKPKENRLCNRYVASETKKTEKEKRRGSKSGDEELTQKCVNQVEIHNCIRISLQLQRSV